MSAWLELALSRIPVYTLLSIRFTLYSCTEYRLQSTRTPVYTCSRAPTLYSEYSKHSRILLWSKSGLAWGRAFIWFGFLHVARPPAFHVAHPATHVSPTGMGIGTVLRHAHTLANMRLRPQAHTAL